MESNNIAYLVMPPGTGKSHYHDLSKGIIEADTIVPCKSTSELKRLRTKAKMTNNWHEYDNLWSSLIAEQLGLIMTKDMCEWGKYCDAMTTSHSCDVPKRIVLLVPHKDVARNTSWTYLGTLCLQLGRWGKNLSARGDFQSKFIRVWNDAAQDCEPLDSNEHLSKLLYQLCASWIDNIH